MTPVFVLLFVLRHGHEPKNNDDDIDLDLDLSCLLSLPRSRVASPCVCGL